MCVRLQLGWKIMRVALICKTNQIPGLKKTKTHNLKADSYLFIIQILQRFFPSALPDLHLPRLGDVGLPVDDSPLTPAPTRWQRVKVERLVVRGAFHWAEHAAEFLPRPGGAVGAHALEEGWYFPGGRHALSGWSVGKKRSSAPTSYCIGLCSRRLSERRWTHYNATEKLTNAAKTVTLSSIWWYGHSLQSLLLQANSLELLTHEFKWACSKQLISLIGKWRERERDLLSVETKILYRQQEEDVSWWGITSGIPRRPLLSRVKPQLQTHQGTVVTQLCLRGLTDPRSAAITQSAPRRVPSKSHPYRRRRALSVQHHTLLILLLLIPKIPNIDM